MRHETHSTQVYSPFGGAYVPESHGDGFQVEPRKPSGGKTAALLAVLLIGCTTAAAATAKHRSLQRSEYAIPMQVMSSFISKLPGTAGFEEALY
jgi:hypothetical protein